MRLGYYAKANLALIAMGCIIPLLSALPQSITGGSTVKGIELFQSLWLLFGMVFTWRYIRPRTLPDGLRQFWTWSTLWWLVLFGRGTSWGRDFFPQEPHLLLRTISVVLIGGLIVMFLSQKPLRQALKNKLSRHEVPLATLFISVVMFLLGDCVEHHRLLAPVLLWRPENQDFIEEMFELPMMFGLFIIAYGMMRHDKVALRQTRLAQRHAPEPVAAH